MPIRVQKRIEFQISDLFRPTLGSPACRLIVIDSSAMIDASVIERIV